MIHIQKIHLILLLILFGINTFAHSQAVPDTSAHQDDILALTHVNLIPMDRELILEDYTLIVRDGKIDRMGPASSIEIPDGAIEIDGTGKFLIPALSDMHVHLEGDAWNIMYPPELKFTPKEINYEDILFIYLAKGITTLQVMSAFPEHVALREKIKANQLLGPSLVLSRMIDGVGKAWPPPISTWIEGADQARSAVQNAYETGYDRIKVYSFLDKPSYDTIMKVAGLLKMPVDGHIPLSTSVEHIIASGQVMVAHSEEFMQFAPDYKPETIHSMASQLAEGNVWLTATLITSRNLVNLFEHPDLEFSKPGTAKLHPLGMGIWTYIYENLYKPIPESHQQYIKLSYETFQVPFVKDFFTCGGKLLSGSDVLIPSNLPGFTLHKELEELVNAGLTPYEALRVSTTNAHEFLDDLGQAGTIEPGKRASLVLLSANPLEDISNTTKIKGIIHQGRWISNAEIKSRLEQIEISYSELATSKSPKP